MPIICGSGPGAAFCADFWTDDNKNSYLCLSIHYIDEKFLLQYRVIAHKYIPSELSQDGELVRDTIFEILTSYDIDVEQNRHKITFVTDRGSNLDRGLRLAGIRRMKCGPHLISNVLKNAFKTDAPKELLKKCKQLVNFSKKNSLNDRLETKLVAAQEVRWGTILKMMLSIKRNLDTLTTFLTEMGKLAKIEGINVQILTDTINFLKPFNEATLKMEVNKSPTVHLVWLYFRQLNSHLEDSLADSPIVTALKTNCRQYFSENSAKLTNEYHLAAIYLNPAMRSLHLFSDEQKQSTLKLVRQINKL